MTVMNKDTFSDLVCENMHGMYRLAYGILQNNADAEDAVGEAVLKAYKNLESLRQYNRAKAWLMQITANTAKTMYEKRKKVLVLEEPIPEQQVYQNSQDSLWDIIQELSENYRTVIILYYYEQLKIKEIATILKISEGTIKTRLLRAKQKLAKMI